VTSGPLLIFGAGGHAREIAWLVRESSRFTLTAYVVTEPAGTQRIDGVEVLSLDAAVAKFPKARYVVGIGDGTARRRVAEQADRAGLSAVTLVHPTARVGSPLDEQAGIVLFANSVISVGVAVGRHTHVNFAATISHDCVVGEFATLSPGVHVAGNVDIGEGVLLGIGVNVVNGTPGKRLRIGAGAVVGAGACVLREVEAASTVAGVPARLLGRQSGA